MTTPEISRRTAWMKLAVLIADGLPEPQSISFDSQGPMVELATAADFVQWMRALDAVDTRHGAPFVSSTGTHLYSATRSDWHGMTLGIGAHIKPAKPDADTEDLSKVRELAGGAS